MTKTQIVAVALARLMEAGKVRARVLPGGMLLLERSEVDAIATAVAERLTAPAGDELVDAATLAKLLGVSRAYVYENAERLGAVKLGSGPKARLRFDVQRALEAREPAAPVKRQPRRRGRARLTPEVAGSTVAPTNETGRRRANVPAPAPKE